MTLQDLGNLGEFLGSIGVIGSLVYLAIQIRPTVAEAPKVDGRMLTDPDWNALCHVSCSALLGGEPCQTAVRAPRKPSPSSCRERER